VNVGKMHTVPIEGDFGFHERHVVENKDRDHPSLPFYLDNWDKAIKARGAYKPSRVTYVKRPDYDDVLGAFVGEQDKDLHPDVFVGETACWWLERYPGQEPFFLQVGLPGPHPPYDPTQDALDLYQYRDLPEPIQYDFDTQPAPLRALRANHLEQGHDAVVHLNDPTPEQLRRQRAHYFANVTMIDEQVGEIIDRLEKRGVLDNTVIIFTSDHGDCLNDHGHSQKWNMFEQSVHVPVLIWWPGKVPAGKEVSDLVSLFDFGPTIREYAGVELPDWMEARSLADVLSDMRDDPRERVFAEHSNDAILTGTDFMTMIHEGDWKLVHFVDCDEGQLFNLASDPDERDNLWDQPKHEAKRQDLIDQILKWRIMSARKTQGFVRMLADRCH
jgi:arylsulfatase